MAVANTTGPKGKADKLFSKIIRRSGACESCDYVCPPSCDAGEGSHRKGCRLQCAHLISRHLSATRCEVRNAFSLCAKCHYHFTNWPLEFASFVLSHRSEGEYASLRTLAQSGVKVNWEQVNERLEQLWAELRDTWDF